MNDSLWDAIMRGCYVGVYSLAINTLQDSLIIFLVENSVPYKKVYASSAHVNAAT